MSGLLTYTVERTCLPAEVRTPALSTGTVSFSYPILIVNFNGGEHLAHCLDSIAAQAPNADVLIVDNDSSDDSERAVGAQHSRVTLRRNSVNLGFARAVNQGVAATRGDLILVLNPDCRLLPAAVETLVTEIRSHPDCGIAAPQVLNDNGTIQGNARGDPNMLTGLFGRTTFLTHVFPGSRVARRNVQLDAAAPGTVSRDVDWVSGACMLIRRDAFEAVRGFDERYFLYWEDADLCRRLRARGYTIRYVPGARVAHSVGRSSRFARALAIRAFHRSAYIYYATHVARTRFARGLAWVLLEGRCRWKLLASRRVRI